MKEGLVISLVAIAIAIISLMLVFFSHNSIQDNLLQLNNNYANQSSQINSLKSQTTASQQLIYKSANNSVQAQSAINQMQNTIQSVNNRISNLTDQVNLLKNRIANLENSREQSTPTQPSNYIFTPVALQDDKGNLWTSWFIKESLYYPTLYSTSCDAPSIDCYIHFSNIDAPNGTGIEADTIGSSVYGYWFLGYSQEYVVPENGTVTISGNFFKNDTFSQIYDHVEVQHPSTSESYGVMIPTPTAHSNSVQIPEGRSHIFVFILDRDPNIILGQKEAVLSSDNATTWYNRSVTFNLTPGQVFRVGIGAGNNWATDYNVYVAWSGVTIHAAPAWSPVQ